MTHPLDAALLTAMPTITVPRYGAFEPLTAPGQRLLVASNGLFLEVRREWLHAIAECGCIDADVQLPYGSVQPQLDLPRGALPSELIDAFVEVARARLPNECAGAITLDAPTGEFALRIHGDNHASPASVSYRVDRLAAHESLVVDIHSHGHLPAGFSGQDDRDDAGCTKVAVVIGRVAEPEPEIAVRLCLHGLFRPLLLGRWTEHGATACPT